MLLNVILTPHFICVERNKISTNERMGIKLLIRKINIQCKQNVFPFNVSYWRELKYTKLIPRLPRISFKNIISVLLKMSGLPFGVPMTWNKPWCSLFFAVNVKRMKKAKTLFIPQHSSMKICQNRYWLPYETFLVMMLKCCTQNESKSEFETCS